MGQSSIALSQSALRPGRVRTLTGIAHSGRLRIAAAFISDTAPLPLVTRQRMSPSWTVGWGVDLGSTFFQRGLATTGAFCCVT
jgi:hypothetical protein